MSFKSLSLLLRKMADMLAKSVQFKLDCKSLRKGLNSFCKVLRHKFLLLISICKRFC